MKHDEFKNTSQWKRFQKIYIPIFHTLEDLQEVINNKISQKAHRFLSIIIKPKFMLASKVTKKSIIFLHFRFVNIYKKLILLKHVKHTQVDIDYHWNAEREFHSIFLSVLDTLTNIDGMLNIPRLAEDRSIEKIMKFLASIFN